jgi:hypothetical protein
MYFGDSDFYVDEIVEGVIVNRDDLRVAVHAIGLYAQKEHERAVYNRLRAALADTNRDA